MVPPTVSICNFFGRAFTGMGLWWTCMSLIMKDLFESKKKKKKLKTFTSLYIVG